VLDGSLKNTGKTACGSSSSPRTTRSRGNFFAGLASFDLDRSGEMSDEEFQAMLRGLIAFY
jgi:hypothetical protein